jgi:cation diffusion facilitator CzcD-associated flavoprotein CzcO
MDITSNKSPQATELDALVIGAGFAGLYQLLCLRDCLGLSVKALEAGGGVAARRPAILGGVPGYDDRKDANDTAADFIKRKIRSIVKDRATAAILSDIDLPTRRSARRSIPKLFTIIGPGSPSVLCNMPVAIEQHADWIADCIEHMRDAGLKRIEARPDSMDQPAHRLIGRARVQRGPPGCPS